MARPVNQWDLRAARSMLVRWRVQPARHYRQLLVWQLADDVRQRVYEITRRPSFKADPRLRAQTDDAIESVCRNIAEGFAGTRKQFRNHLLIARSSLNELTDCLRAGHLKGYLNSEDLLPIFHLTRRLFPALASLMRHLQMTKEDGSPSD